MVSLKGERVLLRPGRPEDVGALVRIRNEPEVARRWGTEDIEGEVEEGFVGNDGGFVAEVEGEVVGAIQYGEEEDPMYRHANIDLFLATSHHGRGLGTEFGHADGSRCGRYPAGSRSRDEGGVGNDRDYRHVLGDDPPL